MQAEFLANSFENISQEFRGIRLIVARRNREADDETLRRWFNRTFEERSFLQEDIWPTGIGGRYAVQRLESKTTKPGLKEIVDVNQDEHGNLSFVYGDQHDMPEVVWYMPNWNFYLWPEALWNEGFCAMWLYREYGRDPLNPRWLPDAIELSRALESLSITMGQGQDWLNAINLPDWCDTKCQSDPRFSKSIFGDFQKWLFLIMEKGKFRRLRESVTGIDLWCCDDIALEIARLIREEAKIPAPRDESQGTENNTQNTQTKDGFSEDGRTFKWAGVSYELTETAAKMVRLLRDAYPDSCHELHLQAEGDFSSDIRNLVRYCKLENLVISVDGRKGMWRLSDPKQKKRLPTS